MKKFLSVLTIAAMIFASTPTAFATTTINAAGNPNNTAASIADDVNFADAGTLTITGAAVSIDTAAAPVGLTEVVTDAVTATTTANGIITFNAAHTGASNIYGRVGIAGSNEILTINLDGTGSLTLYGDAGVNNGVIMSNNSTLNLITGVDLTSTGSAVSNDSGAATGTVNLLGSSTLTGTVGGAGVAALSTFAAGANGSTSTVTGALFATTTTISGTGTLNTAAITGTTVNFAGGNGTLSVDDTRNVTAAITTATTNTGTLTLEGTTTVSGQVGTASAALAAINSGVAGKTGTFSSDVFATTLTNTSTGNTALNGNFGSSAFSTGVISFNNAAGTVTVADGKSIFGSILSGGNGTGNLTFLGTSTVSGAIGLSTAADIATITHSVAGKTLTFGGNVFATTLTNGAANTIDIGANTLTFTDVTLNAASTLNLTINNGSSYGKILTSGTTTIGAANIINVNLAGGITNGSTYNVIVSTTDGATAPTSVTDNSAFYSFSASEIAASGDITLTATSNAAAVAATQKASATFAAVDSALSNAPSADFTNAIGQLYSINSNAEATTALESLAPDTNAGTLEASREGTSQFLGSVSNRLGSVRGGGPKRGVSTGDALNGTGFWIQGLGSHAKQDARHGDAGYQANIFGTAIGADKLIDNHVRVGLAGSYGFANVDSKSIGSPGTDVNSFGGVLYGSYDSMSLGEKEGYYKNGSSIVDQAGDDSWYVDSMLAFTENDYDSHRTIFLGGANTRSATADHSGQQYSTKIEMGYTFRSEVTQALEATPFASIGYNYLHMGSYSEKGADSLNLNVRGEGYHAINQVLGAKLAYPVFSKRLGTFTPSVKAGWLIDYIGDRFQSTSSFQGGGSSFKTQGADPAKNGFLLGAELAFLNKGNMTLTANWDMELRDQYMNNTAGGTVRFDL